MVALKKVVKKINSGKNTGSSRGAGDHVRFGDEKVSAMVTSAGDTGVRAVCLVGMTGAWGCGWECRLAPGPGCRRPPCRLQPLWFTWPQGLKHLRVVTYKSPTFVMFNAQKGLVLVRKSTGCCREGFSLSRPYLFPHPSDEESQRFQGALLSPDAVV